MKQQPFSIYCEKFRLVAPHFSPPSLELVPILTPCPNLGQRSNAAKFAPSKLKVELLRRQVERLGHPNSFQDLSSRPPARRGETVHLHRASRSSTNQSSTSGNVEAVICRETWEPACGKIVHFGPMRPSDRSPKGESGNHLRQVPTGFRVRGDTQVKLEGSKEGSNLLLLFHRFLPFLL